VSRLDISHKINRIRGNREDGESRETVLSCLSRGNLKGLFFGPILLKARGINGMERKAGARPINYIINETGSHARDERVSSY